MITSQNTLPKLSYKLLHEVAWLIRIDDIDQELLLSTNSWPGHLMIIHTAGLDAPAYWWRPRGRGRCPLDLPCGVVRSRGVCSCVGRDVVLLWPSAECGIAIRSDTTLGSSRSPSGSPPAGARAPRAALPSASQSRKCGLLALSPRNKWLQHAQCKPVNINRSVIGWQWLSFAEVAVTVTLVWRKVERLPLILSQPRRESWSWDCFLVSLVIGVTGNGRIKARTGGCMQRTTAAVKSVGF